MKSPHKWCYHLSFFWKASKINRGSSSSSCVCLCVLTLPPSPPSFSLLLSFSHTKNMTSVSKQIRPSQERLLAQQHVSWCSSVGKWRISRDWSSYQTLGCSCDPCLNPRLTVQLLMKYSSFRRCPVTCSRKSLNESPSSLIIGWFPRLTLFFV